MEESSLKSSGFKDHRLVEGDKYFKKEVKALEIFNTEHPSVYNRSQIVFGTEENGEPKEYLTDREERILLSTIQWLGTPVGQSFLEKLKEESNGQV